MKLLLIGRRNGHIAKAGKIAHEKGVEVTHCDAPVKALDHLRSGKGADLVMIDVTEDIETFITALRGEHMAVDVVACGVEPDSKLAVKAIEAGAKEYVPLPPDPDLIAAVLEAVADDDHTMIADDPAMQPVVDMAKKVAPSAATVLITGESGTGKEVMANYIHANSTRADQAFVSLNCAAIPENLLESELFGHEKGAFTGAVAQRIGKFEEADGGTLFLDEISEMHPSLQAKLLRAIQERQIDRVGGKKPVDVDIRLIATTNRNLKKAVKQGDFREDLYFRLNVIKLTLPPLRDRVSDIPKLAKFFADKYAENNNLPARPITDTAMDQLKNYAWPGNVRELENTMHRAVLLANPTEIDEHALILEDDSMIDDGQGVARDAELKTIVQAERELIQQTLRHTLGDRSKAANILGISIRVLRQKLDDYEMNELVADHG
jgi:DNA-binding NtrC family response regulator